MTHKTLSAAFRHANRMVSGLYSYGRGQHLFNTWSTQHRAWWQGNPTQYATAVRGRRNALAEEALMYLGYDQQDVWGRFDDEVGGWQDIVRAYVARYPL